jgi:hypothetical protein
LAVGELAYNEIDGGLYIGRSAGGVVQINSPGSGGNVSNSGTPANGQWAQWTDATHIQGVVTGSMPFLPLTGGTLTGAFNIQYGSPTISLLKSASGQGANIYGLSGGSTRWLVTLGDTAAESGSNAGSNFTISRYNDAGAALDTPFSINRATAAVNFTGSATYGGTVTINGGGTALSVPSGGASLASLTVTGGGTPLSVPSGGASFAQASVTGAGGLSVSQSATIGATATAAGFIGTGAGRAPFVASQANSPTANGEGQFSGVRCLWAQSSGYSTNSSQLLVGNQWYQYADFANGVAFGSVVSDARLKQDIASTEFDCLATIERVPLYRYRWKKTSDALKPIGVIAQELYKIEPSFVIKPPDNSPEQGKEFWSVDTNNVIAALIGAVQQLTARVKELEGRMA